ncbi:MAG: molybdopterin-dependent oxidoreductase [Desulfobacteraceae bacterium]|nr:molybdopterin-dependent oxidoreductase [Desulfobacteraceae bacterium]
MEDKNITVTINTKRHTLAVSPNETLLRVIRDRIGLTGTKNGCGEGECGACMVIRNGKPVNACLIPAMACDGDEITTIEGLADGPDRLHPLQDAFISHGAVQCGFCTPGMLISAKALLDDYPNPPREQIRKALSGNLCRCTGYQKIVDAVSAAASGTVPSEKPEAVIGGDYPRRDAIEHVTGVSKFGADITHSRAAVGKILRSEYAHARIKHIDVSAAEELDGVLAVVTGADVPRGYFGVDIKDRLVFAREKVRYRGDEVAAVAAETEAIAQKALSLIRVDYEPLEPVFDVREAMADDAPVIHEQLMDYAAGFETEKQGNICTMAHVRLGDVEKGLADADLVLESTFRTQIQHQASIEPHAAMAEIDSHGRILITTTNQKPFAVRRYLSHAMQIPMINIRVNATKIGGGFGGKLEMIVEPYAVLLARKCGRPVKIVYTRAEEFLATTPRHPASFKIKSGVKKDGTITAMQAEFIYDTGAYSGNGPTTVTLCAQVIGGLYRIPNVRLDGYCVYTNKMNCGSMRGPSAPQTTFALESHIDDLARAIDMDTLDFRLKNLLEPGEKTAVGQTLVDMDFKKTVLAVADAMDWRAPITDENTGKGLACVYWLSGGWSTSVTVKINEDGSVSVVTAAVDMGTGYLYTSVIQIVAEALGLDPDDVHLVQGDTDQCGYDHGIGGSRGVFTVGKCAKMAAENALEALMAVAARKLKVSRERLESKNSWISVKSAPEKRVSFADISVERHILSGGPITGVSEYLPEMDSIEPGRVKGLSFPAFKGVTIGCHGVKAHVSSDTGEVKILKYVAAHDVGRAVNPLAAEGQIEGGVAMGLGFALSEELMIGRQGEVVNPSFRDYKLPTAMDVPEVESILVETPAAYGPHGAKGLGEPTMAPPAAAVGNAIRDALKLRMTETPMTAERILSALEEKKKAVPSGMP